jgi:hypothetical protein
MIGVAKNPVSQSPVSLRASVLRLPKKGMPVSIEAEADQLAALAREHRLLAVKKFRADLVVSPWKRDGVLVSGRVEGDIVQECVVTLEPIDAHVEEEVSAVFLPDDSKLGRLAEPAGGEMFLDPDGPDAPECFSGTSIDVGALAEQFFALGIDPYPRKEGIEPFMAADVEEGDQPSGTLAEKLAALKRKG